MSALPKLPEEVEKACLNAKNGGSCESIKEDVPRCVIACLYVEEGGDIKDVRSWSREDKPHKFVGDLTREQLGPLVKYDLEFLEYLQLAWDSGQITNQELVLKAFELWITYHRKTDDSK